MAAAALLAVGAVASAYSSVQAGYAEQRAANENARIAEENARLARFQAADDERRLLIEGHKVLGNIQTSYAASGVTMQGSAMDVYKSSVANLAQDALNVRLGGMQKSSAYENQARIDRNRGEYAKESGERGAATSLLTSAGNAYARYK